MHEPVASFDCIGNCRIISIFPARLGSKMNGIEKKEGLMVRYVKARLKSVRLERRLVFDPNDATSKTDYSSLLGYRV